MTNQNQSLKMTRQFIIPAFIGLLSLTACSQNTQVEKDKGGSSGNGSGAVSSSVAKNTGPTSGTVGANGSSKVNTREGGGDRSNFNYLPGEGPNGYGNNANDTSDITLAGLKDPNNLLSQRIIYFDYDKSAIRPEFLVLINTHAKLIAKYPNLKVRLEGHADERGTREYNVALSAARAESVKRLMGLQGARGAQMRTIGYGEEVPIVAGQGERSWQKNRRVEIKYENY